MSTHQREPIEHTCPKIDKYINWIKMEITREKDIRMMSHDDLIERSISMSSELESCIEYLEEMRKSNDTLRKWGINEAEKVDDLEKELEQIQEQNEKNI